MFKKIILDGEVTRWSVNEEGLVRNDENEKFLTGTILQTYRYINFRWGNKRKNKAVHRLVAEAFLPNPNNLPYVHHKDGNRLNNNVENLEWISIKDNSAIENKLPIKKQKARVFSEDELKEEVWKNYKDTHYQVSNIGRVKNTKTNRILKGTLEDCGYYSVKITLPGDRDRRFFIHRLVFDTFIGTFYEVINHKDGNKLNNHLSNLEGITQKENMQKAANETNAWHFRRVAQYDEKGKLIQTFLNASDAARHFGILPSSMRNCINKYGHYKNWVFKYIEESSSAK